MMNGILKGNEMGAPDAHAVSHRNAGKAAGEAHCQNGRRGSNPRFPIRNFLKGVGRGRRGLGEVDTQRTGNPELSRLVSGQASGSRLSQFGR